MIYLYNILRKAKLKWSKRLEVGKYGSFKSKYTWYIQFIGMECCSDLYFAGQSGKQLKQRANEPDSTYCDYHG